MCPADPPGIVDFAIEAYGSSQHCTLRATALRQTAEVPARDPFAASTGSKRDDAGVANAIGQRVLVLLNPHEVARRDQHAFLRDERGDVGVPVPADRDRNLS